jgi:hypothetical protein
MLFRGSKRLLQLPGARFDKESRCVGVSLPEVKHAIIISLGGTITVCRIPGGKLTKEQYDALIQLRHDIKNLPRIQSTRPPTFSLERLGRALNNAENQKKMAMIK